MLALRVLLNALEGGDGNEMSYTINGIALLDELET
jgi:hypothetical protein